MLRRNPACHQPCDGPIGAKFWWFWPGWLSVWYLLSKLLTYSLLCFRATPPRKLLLSGAAVFRVALAGSRKGRHPIHRRLHVGRNGKTVVVMAVTWHLRKPFCFWSSSASQTTYWEQMTCRDVCLIPVCTVLASQSLTAASRLWLYDV